MLIYVITYDFSDSFLYIRTAWHEGFAANTIFLFSLFPQTTSSGIMFLSDHGFYISVCLYEKYIFR